jgi:Fe-Mn family superoxide dismutase
MEVACLPVCNQLTWGKNLFSLSSPFLSLLYLPLPAIVPSPNAGDLLEAIERDFGSFDIFHAEMTAKTVAVEGSGWGWLGYEKGKDRLVVTTCANQDPLQATTGLIPMLGIDVWEHAYYLQYKNVRPEYVNKIWDVVNWADVARRLSDAQ